MTLVDVIASRTIKPGSEKLVNVGQSERMVSLAAGTIVAVYGVSHLGLRGLVTAVAGAALMYRGLTGHCPTYEKLDINTASGD